MDNQTPDINALFTAAGNTGIVSRTTATSLCTFDLAEQIQGGLGVPADSVRSSEVFLMMVVLDDSGSLNEKAPPDPAHPGRSTTNAEVLIDSTNSMIEALRSSAARDDILIAVMGINSGTIVPFTSITDSSVKLTPQNYSANGYTPLYDGALTGLSTMLAKELELLKADVGARGVTLIVTDGGENLSKRTANDVKQLVTDMRTRENHIIQGLGIYDGRTDYKAVFASMGLDPAAVLTPANDPSSIRKAFLTASRSSVRASQGAADFSAAATAGLKP